MKNTTEGRPSSPPSLILFLEHKSAETDRKQIEVEQSIAQKGLPNCHFATIPLVPIHLLFTVKNLNVALGPTCLTLGGGSLH